MASRNKQARHEEPLRVRARLRSGVVSDLYLPLDGILLYQAHREAEGAQTFALPGEYSSRGGVSLPLATAQYANHDYSKWYQYYRCSWAQWPEHTSEAADHWNKRFDLTFADLIDFRGRRGRVEVGSGPYKAYHQTIFYRAALWVEWYCVGDRAQIEALLCTVTHIGKKQTQGWGRVIAWDIQRMNDDYSVWMGNRLMRGVPPSEAPGYPTGVYGIRPSYWKKSNQMLLALPS